MRVRGCCCVYANTRCTTGASSILCTPLPLPVVFLLWPLPSPSLSHDASTHVRTQACTGTNLHTPPLLPVSTRSPPPPFPLSIPPSYLIMFCLSARLKPVTQTVSRRATRRLSCRRRPKSLAIQTRAGLGCSPTATISEQGWLSTPKGRSDPIQRVALIAEKLLITRATPLAGCLCSPIWQSLYQTEILPRLFAYQAGVISDREPTVAVRLSGRVYVRQRAGTLRLKRARPHVRLHGRSASAFLSESAQTCLVCGGTTYYETIQRSTQTETSLQVIV